MELEIPSSINSQIEAVEEQLLQLEQVDCPLVHRFAPNVYMREITMPAGSFIIGHEHKTEHFNVVLTGKARVMIDGVIEDIIAPCVFVSKPSVRKVLYIVEEMKWATVHPTEETNLEILDSNLIKKSDSFIKHSEIKAIEDSFNPEKGGLIWHG
jgi:formaldehyde-activating enzyme involved in methanogenesis